MSWEKWKPIAMFNGEYEVSSKGRIRRSKMYFDKTINGLHFRHVKSPAKLLRVTQNSHGYNRVFIKGKYHRVARLVATAFVDNPNDRKEVDHINTIRTDDRVENLRLVTHKENMNNSKTTRNKIVGASIAFKSPKIYVYDTSKSKRGKCVLSFLSPKTAAKFFGVHYRVIMKALDNADERVCGYLIRSERKTYKTKSKNINQGVA